MKKFSNIDLASNHHLLSYSSDPVLLKIPCLPLPLLMRMQCQQNFSSSETKTCSLDPIPTSLVKECADVLKTHISNIKHYSLKEGSFLNCFKTAYVTPLLKKPSMYRDVWKNFRPVSNISFISKLIEKIVAKQLNDFISQETSNVHKSTDRTFHSTETELLKIQNNISTSLDSGKAVGLTLLDLSTASTQLIMLSYIIV